MGESDANRSLIYALTSQCNLLTQENERMRKELSTMQEEIKQKNEQLRRLKEEKVSISVINRWNIGKYLHDHLAQKLTFARILAGNVKNALQEKGNDRDLFGQFDEIIRIIDEGTEEVRDLSHDIIPLEIEKQNLSASFYYLREKVQKYHGVEFQLEIDEAVHSIRQSEVATNLYNIAQEAVKNAVVHGRAKKIKVALVEQAGWLYLHVKNSGRKFTSPLRAEGVGINIMRQRAKEIGALFSIRQTGEDTGYTTCVTCKLPLERAGGVEG